MSIPLIVDAGVRDAAFWLAAANQSVRSYCGWHVAPVITQTLRLDGTGSRRLLVPSGRIVRLVRAVNDGEDVTAQVKWSTKGILNLPAGWTSDEGGVLIELEHGHDAAADIAGIISAIATRAGAGAAAAGIAQQNIGPAGVRYTGEAVPLLATEEAALDPYRLTWGA